MNARHVVMAVVLGVSIGVPLFILGQLNNKLSQLNLLDMRLRLIQRSILYDCHCGGPFLKTAESTGKGMQYPAPQKRVYRVESPFEVSRELPKPTGEKPAPDLCVNQECSEVAGPGRKTVVIGDGTIGRVFIGAF